MLEVITPALSDMWFRESLMADEKTMSYDNTAIRLFLKHGFYEEYRTEEKIVLKKDL